MVNRVKITLNAAAREEAKATMRLRGLDIPSMFEGPVFENVVDSGIEAGFFSVELEDGTCYAYPVTTIARLACYSV
jgi:hypothetical protein